jgi:N-acyl-D-amino-acid deacylase
MKKYLLTLLICFLLVSNLAAQTQAKVKSLDSVLTYLHERDLFNGTALLAENGQVVYKKAFGTANIATNEPLKTTSAFNLASVSKQFFCMMTMILQEQGKLQYDDPVQKHLPTFPYPNISIRHLMTHTSGLPEYFELCQKYLGSTDTVTNARVLAMYADKKPALDFQTGNEWAYSNTNYVILASLIEKVSGKPCTAFFQEKIVRPLDLKDTYIYHLKMKTSPANRVCGFQVNKGKRKSNDLIRFDGIVGDGNVYSSAEDLLKWEQAWLGEKLVKQSSVQAAWMPVKLNDGSTAPYGFGWQIHQEGKKIFHSGSWAGFKNLLIRYPAQKWTLVLLSNGTTTEGLRVVDGLFDGKALVLPKTQLIRNVQVIDGTGAPAYLAAVRIKDQRIHDIGDLQPYPNESVTEGKGQVLAPGFIDSHSHHDWSLQEEPQALAMLNQGITTIVVGQDGGGNLIDTIQARLKKQPAAVNIATYTGHTMLRSMTMGGIRGALFRQATAKEVDSMKVILAHEMKKGSLGLATGLEYESAFYSNRDEVLQLAQVAADHQGRYISHIRSEDTDIDDALEEIIEIGRTCKIPVKISHIKVSIKSKWGYSKEVLEALQAARAQGIDITADCYPYDFWQSTIRILFPKRDYTNSASADYAVTDLVDPAGTYLTRYLPNPAYAGKSLTEIAQMRQETPGKTLLYLVAAAEAYEIKNPDADAEGVMGKAMSDEDVRNFLAWSHTNICSDGSVEGHPRGHGAFTRVLARYVREQKLLSLENAIHKMTGLTAEHLGLRNRGLIAPGYFADLVLFDPTVVKDNAVIGNNKALSDGINKVWVNGEAVYLDKKGTGKFSGVFLRK